MDETLTLDEVDDAASDPDGDSEPQDGHKPDREGPAGGESSGAAGTRPGEVSGGTKSEDKRTAVPRGPHSGAEAAPVEHDPSHHVEHSSGPHLAGVSDKGLKHADNQDAMAMATVEILVSPVDVPPIYIAVVCDGVSSSDSGAVASSTAAKTVAMMLERALNRNPDANARAEMRSAVSLANKAVCAIDCTPDNEKSAPATTIVAAVVRDGTATIAWIGDSRAYWVSDKDEGLLTRDDSWCNAMIDAGRLTEEQALTSVNRHALFRCLGGESGDEVEPAVASVTTFCISAGTRLLLCSDGFWNYAPSPEDVARLVRQTPANDPLRTAKHLVNYAIVGGGHDNITVVVVSL